MPLSFHFVLSLSLVFSYPVSARETRKVAASAGQEDPHLRQGRGITVLAVYLSASPLTVGAELPNHPSYTSFGGPSLLSPAHLLPDARVKVRTNAATRG